MQDEADARTDESGQARVVVYTLGSCPSCSQARALLRRRRIRFEEVHGDDDVGFRRMLAELTGGVTAPQILIDEEPIGGAAALARLDRRGVLLPRVGRQPFPRALVRRRLSLWRVLRAALVALGGGPCGPWRYEVEIVDREGHRLAGERAGSAEEAAARARALNQGGGRGAPNPAQRLP